MVGLEGPPKELYDYNEDKVELEEELGGRDNFEEVRIRTTRKGVECYRLVFCHEPHPCTFEVLRKLGYKIRCVSFEDEEIQIRKQEDKRTFPN